MYVTDGVKDGTLDGAKVMSSMLGATEGEKVPESPDDTHDFHHCHHLQLLPVAANVIGD